MLHTSLTFLIFSANSSGVAYPATPSSGTPVSPDINDTDGTHKTGSSRLLLKKCSFKERKKEKKKIQLSFKEYCLHILAKIDLD